MWDETNQEGKQEDGVERLFPPERIFSFRTLMVQLRYLSSGCDWIPLSSLARFLASRLFKGDTPSWFLLVYARMHPQNWRDSIDLKACVPPLYRNAIILNVVHCQMTPLRYILFLFPAQEYVLYHRCQDPEGKTGEPYCRSFLSFLCFVASFLSISYTFYTFLFLPW